MTPFPAVRDGDGTIINRKEWRANLASRFLRSTPISVHDFTYRTIMDGDNQSWEKRGRTLTDLKYLATEYEQSFTYNGCVFDPVKPDDFEYSLRFGHCPPIEYGQLCNLCKERYGMHSSWICPNPTINTCQRAYEPWTTGEDINLQERWASSMEVEDIAKAHERSPLAIIYRLEKLKLIPKPATILESALQEPLFLKHGAPERSRDLRLLLNHEERSRSVIETEAVRRGDPAECAG